MKRSTSLAIALFLVIAARPAAAGPLFAPGTKLFVIKTDHFDIIFPKTSRPSALRLSSMAESVYAEVAGKLEAALPARVPVVITPDQGVFNGYTSPFPYMHIVLYDTSLDLGWTAFKDNFRYLFLHELTHAVSLQIKAPWASFFSGIFGSWVLPGLLNTPEFMVEGVAVSLESGDGSGGRANDPLVKERLRQDIYENLFKTPIEASALYDEYPNGNIYYEYGGLFNAYIQKTYGMGKYAELWRAMGDLILPTSLDPYEVSFYKAFRKVYDMAFIKAWADFRDSLSIRGIVDPPEALGPRELASMPGGLAGNEGGVYWVDARSNRGMRLDASTLESSPLFDADPSWAITDASPEADGRSGRLLVSRTLYFPDGRSRAETGVYDLASKRFLPGGAVADMREARFFRDGIVGIVSNLHDSDFVFSSQSGTRVLLPGSEGVMYASPAVLDDRRVALIVAIGGRRSIGILEVDSGELRLIRPVGNDAGLLDYTRQLSARRNTSGPSGDQRSPRDYSSRRLYFNYDSDDGFYKLGSLAYESDEGELTIDTVNYSGGVLFPQEAGSRVFYLGRFSEGEKVCRYPGAAGSFGEGSRRVAFSLEPFDPKPALAERDAALAATETTAIVEPYRPLAYANPFNMWALYPDLALIAHSLRIFGVFYFQDPTASDTVLLNAGYDSSFPFADSSLTWVNDALPVSFSSSLGDNLAYGVLGSPERQSSASLSASLALPVSPFPRSALLGLGGSFLARGDGASGSPYSWGYSGWNATASALVGWEGRIPGMAASTSRGLDFVSYHDLDIASLTYKAEAHLVAAYDRIPLRLEFWGAWATSPILRLDSSSSVFASDRRPPYVEYDIRNVGSSDLLAEGSLGYRLADQAIHANILDLYINRLLVDIGFRGAYFQSSGFASSFARVSLDLGAAQGMAYGVARAFGEAYVLLDGTNALGFRLGYQLSFDQGTPLRGSARPLAVVGVGGRPGSGALE